MIARDIAEARELSTIGNEQGELSDSDSQDLIVESGLAGRAMQAEARAQPVGMQQRLRGPERPRSAGCGQRRLLGCRSDSRKCRRRGTGGRSLRPRRSR